MAYNLDMSLSVLKLLSGCKQMSFDEAMSCLQQSQPSFFIIQGVTNAISKNHSFCVGQVRDVDAFEEGHICTFPLAVTKSLKVVQQEMHDAVDLFVPFGHEPKHIKQYQRSVRVRMDWNEEIRCVVKI